VRRSCSSALARIFRRTRKSARSRCRSSS
jgi:hypothetical protein